MGGVAQRFGSGSKKKGGKQTLYEPAAGLASGPVGHLDLRFAEADLGRTIDSRALSRANI